MVCPKIPADLRLGVIASDLGSKMGIHVVKCEVKLLVIERGEFKFHPGFTIIDLKIGKHIIPLCIILSQGGFALNTGKSSVSLKERYSEPSRYNRRRGAIGRPH